MLVVLYGFLVGLVFSTTGAGGAILAGFGHLSLFGIKDANTVKVYNQILVALSGLVSSPIYLKQKRVLLILALLLGIGSVFGSLAGSQLSYKYLTSLQSYRFAFGIVTLIVALKLIYDTIFGKGKAFLNVEGSLHTKFERLRLFFLWDNFHTNFLIVSPIVAGFVISFLSSALGVGGGFLIIPYMIFLLRIPAYFVPGTAILTVLITSITSSGNYLRLGTSVDLNFLVLESLGMLLGSLSGPFVSKKLGERNLKIAIGILLLFIGFAYTVGDVIRSTLGVRFF